MHINTYIITFNTPATPSILKIEYPITSITIYIPNPLRCFKCQMLRHHEGKCTKKQIFRMCRENNLGYMEINCDCNLSHWSECANSGNSTTCEVWKREKVIMKLKYPQNLSFPKARKNSQIYNQQTITQKSIPKTNDCLTCTQFLNISQN